MNNQLTWRREHERSIDILFFSDICKEFVNSYKGAINSVNMLISPYLELIPVRRLS